jgi:hypothetical protein
MVAEGIDPMGAAMGLAWAGPTHAAGVQVRRRRGEKSANRVDRVWVTRPFAHSVRPLKLPR